MSNYRITAIDGWYRVRGLDNTIHGAGCTVDDAITEAIESIEGRVERAVHRAERAEARVKEFEDAIASALRIKQLWGPPDDVENLLYSGPDDNVAYEFRALHSMLTKFEELVK